MNQQAPDMAILLKMGREAPVSPNYGRFTALRPTMPMVPQGESAWLRILAGRGRTLIYLIPIVDFASRNARCLVAAERWHDIRDRDGHLGAGSIERGAARDGWPACRAL